MKGNPPTEAITYTRNGSFEPTPDGYVIDTTGAKLQLLPVDANGNVTNNTLAGAYDLQLPTGAPSDPTSSLVNVSIGLDGLVTATFANGEDQMLGKVAMATDQRLDGRGSFGGARTVERRYHRGTGDADVGATQFPGQCQSDRGRVAADPDDHRHALTQP